MTDTELRPLLERLRTGDRDAFEALYRGLSGPVFTVAVRITRDRMLAEDVLQEFFLKLFRTPPEPGVKNPRAYLYRTARNLALDALRSRPDWSELKEGAAARDGPERWQRRLDLEGAFGALGEEERQIAALHLNGGLTFREVAQIVERPLGTVLWKYQKALGIMRNYLNGGAT